MSKCILLLSSFFSSSQAVFYKHSHVTTHSSHKPMSHNRTRVINQCHTNIPKSRTSDSVTQTCPSHKLTSNRHIRVTNTPKSQTDVTHPLPHHKLMSNKHIRVTNMPKSHTHVTHPHPHHKPLSHKHSQVTNRCHTTAPESQTDVTQPHPSHKPMSHNHSQVTFTTSCFGFCQ